MFTIDRDSFLVRLELVEHFLDCIVRFGDFCAQIQSHELLGKQLPVIQVCYYVLYDIKGDLKS